jgi:DNA repair exonuclease SbcCD ATPase subunit
MMQYNHLWEIYDKIAKDLYKKAIPVIKTIVNQKLEIAEWWKYKFFIETEKDWKEVFIPKIYEAKKWIKSARPLSTASGWEAVRVACVLRDAKILLANKRFGINWEFSFNDEIFWSQDADHQNVLIDSLFSSNFASQVFFITHVPSAIERIRELSW